MQTPPGRSPTGGGRQDRETGMGVQGMDRVRIGISACFWGKHRFDGGHKLDRYLRHPGGLRRDVPVAPSGVRAGNPRSRSPEAPRGPRLVTTRRDGPHRPMEPGRTAGGRAEKAGSADSFSERSPPVLGAGERLRWNGGQAVGKVGIFAGSSWTLSSCR